MHRLLVAAALLTFVFPSFAQMAGAPPQNTPAPVTKPAPNAKHAFPKPAKDAAPGGGPDKVWVNLNSAVYHCPGDRYYGKTANGRYMTEAAARSAGAKGPRGGTCFGK